MSAHVIFKTRHLPPSSLVCRPLACRTILRGGTKPRYMPFVHIASAQRVQVSRYNPFHAQGDRPISLSEIALQPADVLIRLHRGPVVHTPQHDVVPQHC